MTRDRVIPRKLRAKALAGLAAAAILISACSDSTPAPTETPSASIAPTSEVLISVLSSPVNVPATDAQPPAPAQPIPTPEVASSEVITPGAQPIPQEQEPAATAQPLPAGEPTYGTFAEDSAQCEALIGEEVPAALMAYLRCGFLNVPELHAQPDGRQIKLPLVVLKSSSANPAPDPIIVLQGGPGGSAIRDFFFSIFARRLPRRRARHHSGRSARLIPGAAIARLHGIP